MASENSDRFVARERTQTIADWEALLYGLFIHFGMSTFTTHEFGRIPCVSEDYAPTGLDVDQWIRVARDAGMRYAVLTAKHHYGHALWPTKASDFSVSTSSNPTDVVDLFVKACAKYGIKPGFYYSAGWDRYHMPNRTPSQYLEFVLEQVRELLTEYGPITEMWFDIPWDFGEENSSALDRIYECCKTTQPDCLVLLNQGFVDGSKVHSVVVSYEGKPIEGNIQPIWPKDINNGERTVPTESGHNPLVSFNGRDYYIPNEVCDTVGQKRWFWGEWDDVRPARQIYEIYRTSVGRGANLLLNIGPDQNGRLPQDFVDRLMEVKHMIDHPEIVRSSVLIGCEATASNVRESDYDAWGPHLAIDMDVSPEGGTRWATDDEVSDAWLEVNLGSAKTIERITISEYGNSIQSFELCGQNTEGDWLVLHRGSTIGGPGVDVEIPEIKVSRLRLNILEAKTGASIWDFAAYEV